MREALNPAPAVVAPVVLVTLVVAVATALAPGPARADSRWVSFSSAAVEASALARRLGGERRDATPLRGLLVVPDAEDMGEGPFPAVVMLHDCRGARPYTQAWARAVASWGYVTLRVNSFFTRHVPPTCDHLLEWEAREAVGGRAFDAFGALEYLAGLPMVDAHRVAVLGWSDGAPLSAVSATGPGSLTTHRFRAAVALTPDCMDFIDSRFVAPVLVLAAARDDWAPAALCRRMAGASAGADAPLEIHVYDRARHGFDDGELGERVNLPRAYNPYRQPARGATLGYHRESHDDALVRVQRFLARHLGAGRGDGREAYALVPALAQAPARTWVIEPHVPGPDRPASGASTFDRLFAAANGEGYDLPFPFERLLARIEAELPGRHGGTTALKKVLIPLGRSLQRQAAAPHYFAHPRVVVAVDTEPESIPASGRAMFLKDRLFLGYQDRAGVIEAISYNEQAARFEFQVVSDYLPGRTPRVQYASRAICVSCHQNGAPLFAEAPWDETNTNTRIAAALARERPAFHGVTARCCVLDPAAIDNATDRANLFSAYQLLWREGCDSDRREAAVRCRAGAFTAMLQHRLSAYSHFDAEHAGYREHFRPLLTANWARRWPDGLNIPNPNVPNRKPLLSPHPADIPAELDPLRARAPLEVWRAEREQDLQQVITGLAEFLPALDVDRLDAHLRQASAALPARRLDAGGACTAVARGEARVVTIRCDEPTGGRDGFELLAEIAPRRASGLSGRVLRLSLGDGVWFSNLRLASDTDSLGARGQSRLRVRQAPRGSHARLPSGDAIDTLVIGWRDRGPGSARSPARVDVRLEIAPDFAPVHGAVERLVARTLAGTSDAFAAAAFQGTRMMTALLEELGAATTPWCCDAPAPKVSQQAHASAPEHDDAGGVPRGFYARCGGCHGGDTRTPPGFLHGPTAEVAENLERCAERIFVRVNMWQLEESERAKSPMPPAAALGAAAGTARAQSELRALLAHVAGLLARRTGQAPSLDALMARGYENLAQCLPAPG